MNSAETPVAAQIADADGDRARARLLLMLPDAVVVREIVALDRACRDFPGGRRFVALRFGALSARRSAAGGLPGGVAMALATAQAELTAYAAGADLPEADR